MTRSEPLFTGRFNPTLIACGFFALSIAFAIVTARCLYADGSFYFVKVLETGNFTEMIGCRSFAGYLFQLPVVIAMGAGITSIPCLTFLFGVGCFCAWPAAMFLCYRMAKEHFWLVMLACAAGYLNAAFVAVGEHIVAHAFFWPVVFVILFVRPLTPFAAVTLLFSSIVLMRSYESMLFLGPVLISLVAWRMISSKERPWQIAVLGAAAVFLAVAVYIAWVGVKYPNVTNYNGFKSALCSEIANPAWTVKMSVFWAALMLGATYPPAAAIFKRPTSMIVCVLVVLIWGLSPILEPQRLHPPEQYNCRFLDLLVPLALTPVAAILSFRPQWLTTRVPDLVRLSAVMLAAQSLWQFSATCQWERHLSEWRNMLTSKTGPIYIVGDRGFNAPDFTWANPCLSIIAGPRHVRAIITPDHVEPWQPFDPLVPQSFPDLERYGLTYTDYKAFLEQKKLVHEHVFAQYQMTGTSAIATSLPSHGRSICLQN